MTDVSRTERSASGIKDGPSCPGCGLANYEGMCPHCRGDQDAYEHELVPPFESSLPDEWQPEPTIYTPGVLDDGINYDD